MKKMNPKNRKIKLNVKLTMLVVGFFFFLIIIKLCYVVLSPSVDGIDLASFASNRNTTHETLYASRGIIYDKDGKIDSYLLKNPHGLADQKISFDDIFDKIDSISFSKI